MPFRLLPTLSAWAIVPDPFASPYDAPEIRRPCLSGHCTGGRFDGQSILTTPIVSACPISQSVRTRNTTYLLLGPAPAYEASYPDAKARLFATLQEKSND
jgi:hypothetical protein